MTWRSPRVFGPLTYRRVGRLSVTAITHCAFCCGPAGPGWRINANEAQGRCPQGAKTEGLCCCFCHDRRRAPRRAPRLAGCGDDASAKRDHQLRDTEAAAEYVSRERVGRSWWSDVLWGEPPFYVSARRVLRGQDLQRRKARGSSRGTSHEVRHGPQFQNGEGDRVHVPGFDPFLAFVPLRRDPLARSHDRVPMGRERNTGHRSDICTRSEICAQRASIPESLLKISST